MPISRPADACALDAPIDSADSEQRAEWWEYDDPFADLPPALLTAEQIKNYARVTGLMYPFQDEYLKGATYEIGISDSVYSWNEKKKKKIVSVAAAGERGIVLEANSITFVQTDVEFRLPQYIAMRFNLHIKLVHRGLLLGTGPIVDPGFRGRLLIPLHNLTSEPLTITLGEKIVWIEFTKTLFGHQSAKLGYRTEDRRFRVFPSSKRWQKPETYFQKANSGNPIMSSISGFISETNTSIGRIRAFVYGFGALAFLSIFIAVVGGIYASWTVYNNAISIVRADDARRSSLENRVKHLEDCLTRAKNVRLPPSAGC